MNVTVFLGSVPGNKPLYEKAAEQIGSGLARYGHTLVFGGSKEGLMMTMAMAALNAGGKVIGVQTEMLYQEYGAVEGLTMLEFTKHIGDRIRRMIELGDMFIIFPGGVGTLEEAASIMSMNKLMPSQRKHIFFLSLEGYYDDFEKYLRKMDGEGFATPELFQYCHFVQNFTELKEVSEKVFAK